MKYWQVTVAFETEDDKGKTKTVKEQYLVDAQSGTESEARIYTILEEEGESNFKITSLRESPIKRVIEVA